MGPVLDNRHRPVVNTCVKAATRTAEWDATADSARSIDARRGIRCDAVSQQKRTLVEHAFFFSGLPG